MKTRNFTLKVALAFLAFAFLTSTQLLATSRVQVIHNSADLAAKEVDVWLDNTLLLDDFAFRTASPFIDAPSGTEFTISIKGPDSTDPNDPIWSQNYTLAEGETYVLVANGIVSSEGYDPVKPFNIYVYAMGREMATDMNNTDILVFHGSTDAPTVDVVEIGRSAGTIIDDFMYEGFSGYLELPTADYVLDIRDASGENSVVAYSAPLATLELDGAALVTVASGFLNPENNSNGEAFGLWVALPTGGALIELPVYNPMARVQVIHNSADLAAEVVDVWLDDALLLDDFAFRTASPFIDAPAGTEFTIAIKGPDSMDPSDPIWSQNYTLADGETYVLIANGIVSAEGYDPVEPFDIYIYPMGREMATDMNNTDVLVFHGSTDAPTVDVVEIGQGAGTIIDDFMYEDFAGYLELPTADYVLDIRDETGMNSVVAYSAPLETLGLDGAALVTVASGFLNPGNNSDGEAFGLWVALPTGGELIELPVYEPMARVQVIHNSADLAAEVVDVWLDDTLLLDDFAFRTASPFIDAPAGTEFTIAIKGPDSMDPNDPIWSQDYTLEDGETYVLVANGIVSSEGYDPVKPFDIYVYAMGREMATDMNNTDILVFHGSTDAPTVDVVEIGQGAGTIIDDFMYEDFAGYLELPTADYVLDIRDETGENSVVAYSVPLATLELDGAALVTVASGFLTPENNSNGPAFGLWVALPTGGDLIELPVYEPMARVQVIHNSADLAAEVVDIWLDDALLLDDFAFRTASPFIDAPAGTEFTIAIKGPDSMDPNDPIWSQDYTLEDGETYVLVANGIVSSEGYDPVKPFDIYVYAMGREMATDMNNTDILVFHGSTDAPTVDVVEIGQGAGTIIDDFMYEDFAGYLELPTADYVLDIRDETGENSVVAYSVPLATLELDGAALVTVASGFLTPENNSNGPAFGLWVALPTGGDLIELPVFEPGTARVQVIHNSADAAATMVDVWLDDALLLDDFTFRTASPFVDAPAGINFTIAIKGPDSMDPNDPIWSQNYTLADGETYILVANGIVSASGYDPAEPFDIYVYPMGREMASDMDNTDVLVFHGSTDAPTVDVVEIGQGAGTIVDDLMYGTFDGYLELPTADYVLDIRDASGENSVASFAAPLSSLGLDGQALVVLASGFLVPENNSNGPAFGLFAALPAGGSLVQLGNVTGTEETLFDASQFKAYPNPATSILNVEYNLLEDAEVSIAIYDMLGRKMIEETSYASSNNTMTYQLNTDRLDNGLYILTLNAGENIISTKIRVVN
jgi:sensor domain CHASE-containing protein